ncbi:unnamed protein product [Trichogramma brassicae]|uniref:LIM zinc-binding domain-containing protein n=1 Tax=Trichogramma brassicae TaxID=86971 RepID=A0A6H5IAG4_9HYME|nr:unnamed protein product [Trichogramma brassicae]
MEIKSSSSVMCTLNQPDCYVFYFGGRTRSTNSTMAIYVYNVMRSRLFEDFPKHSRALAREKYKARGWGHQGETSTETMADVATKTKSMSVVSSNNALNGKTNNSSRDVSVCGLQNTTNNGLTINNDNNGLNNHGDLLLSHNNKLASCVDRDDHDDVDEENDHLVVIANNAKNEQDSQQQQQDDDKSLQEIIDSELALRISAANNDAADDDTEDDEPLLEDDMVVQQQQPEITKRIILEPQRGSLIDENEQFITHEIEHYRLIAEPYPNAHVSPDPKDPPDVEDIDVDDEDDEVFEIETETTTTEPTTTTGPSLPSAYEVSNELQLKNDNNHEKEEDISKQAEDDQTTNTLSDFLVTEETTSGGGQSSIVATDKLYQDIDELVVTPSSNCSSGSEDKNNGHLLTDDLLQLDEITEDDSSKYNDNEFKDLSSATFIEHEIPEPISLKEASGVDEKSCSFYETEARSPEPNSVDNDVDESNSSLSISNVPTTTTQTVSTDVTDFKDNNTNTKSSDWLDDHHHVDKELSPVSIVVTQAAEEPQQPQSLQSLPSLHDQNSVGSTPYDSGNFYSQEGKFENYLEKNGRLLEDDASGDLAPLATPDEISEISNAASNDVTRKRPIRPRCCTCRCTYTMMHLSRDIGYVREKMTIYIAERYIVVSKTTRAGLMRVQYSPSARSTSYVICVLYSESREEVITTSSVVSSTKKKKKIEATAGSDASPNHTKTKKTKKSKKSELEKENISVTQTYALESSHRGDLEKPNKEIIATGVSIKQLRASYNNLANLQRSVSDCPKRRYTRSCSDRIRPVADLFEKSSFNKFDALTKKSGAVLHVRSVDASKVQQQLNSVAQNGDANPNCRSCGKVVFQMEQTKAEGLVWHKNCFRCCQCSKQLSVDSYESHESTLYCKPHFKELFQPKPVEESDQPTSDKPDLGLEELSALNVKSRFQVFEKANNNDNHLNEIERSPSQVAVKRSPSILSKLAK